MLSYRKLAMRVLGRPLHTGVFSLTGWSRQIRAGFLVSRVTQDTAMLDLASRTGLSPSVM